MCGVLGWMNVIVGLNESKVQKYLQIDISLHLAIALCEMLPTLTLQNTLASLPSLRNFLRPPLLSICRSVKSGKTGIVCI